MQKFCGLAAMAAPEFLPLGAAVRGAAPPTGAAPSLQ